MYSGAGLQLMKRSFMIDVIYAPLQKVDTDLAQNSSLKRYAVYLDAGRGNLCTVRHCFLDWARLHTIRDGKPVLRGAAGRTIAFGVSASQCGASR